MDLTGGTIRVDSATMRGSVLDVIRVVLACDQRAANRAFRQLKRKFCRLEAACDPIRIDGKHRRTPVAHVMTLAKIVFMLPRRTFSNRLQIAIGVCRLLHGDLTMVREIQQLCFTQETPAGMPEGFCSLSRGEQRRVAVEVVQRQLRREQQDFHEQTQRDFLST